MSPAPRGMRAKEQEQAVAQFKSGRTNVLISTSVGEEGLDVGNCRLVIRFNVMNTVTALVQSRGRARDKSCARFVVIIRADSTEREALPKLLQREENMKEAVSQIMAKKVLLKPRIDLLESSGARKFVEKEAMAML